MMIRRTGLFILLILLAGCATPEAEILSQTDSYPPTVSIQVLLDRPTRPFKSFAILEDTYGGTPEEINGRMPAATLLGQIPVEFLPFQRHYGWAVLGMKRLDRAHNHPPSRSDSQRLAIFDPAGLNRWSAQEHRW